jgi:hypothetical protein
MKRTGLLILGSMSLMLVGGRVVGQVATPAPPPGPGLSTIMERCSGCHSTATVFGQRRSPDDWAATVQLMVDRGAELSADDQSTVVGYLSQHYANSPAAAPAH